MAQKLNGKKVAILATNGFEQSELMSPLDALVKAGCEAVVVSPEGGSIRGWDHTDWGESIDVDITLDDANAAEFDALVLPGGVMNPDHLRTNDKVIRFVRHFVEEGKPIAAICHGPWTLINADAVRGRTMTSYHTIRIDLENAGATWVDREVVVDNGLVTSRNPNDLAAFNAKMIEEIGEGIHMPASKSSRAATFAKGAG